VKNVVVVMQPRSGSSLVTGIFAAHGWWTGETTRDREYQRYENAMIKAQFAGRDLVRGEFVTSREPLEWEPIEPWVLKVGTEDFPRIPADVAVKVYRNPSSILASVMSRNPFTCRKYVAALIERRHEMMDSIAGYTVDTNKLVAGDFAEIKAAIQACGAEFSEALVRSVIDPSRWRH